MVAVIAFGTAGFATIERFSVFDSLYLTVITVASVGFGEIPRELSTAGRAFTMVLIVIGVGSMAYGLSAVTALWVEGDMLNLREKRRMEARIAALSGHIVVAGGGQTGRHIAGELMKTRSMRTVTRLVADESRPALVRAGADAIVSIPTIGALRLASVMLRPIVVSVLDAMLREPGDVRVEEIATASAVAGRTLPGLKLHERVGIIVFAVRQADGRHAFNPPSHCVVRDGDVLIACASPEQAGAARKVLAEG